MKKEKSFSTLIHKRSGFTLIELLLYVAISGIVLMVTSFLLITFLQARIKNQTMMEVGQGGIHVMQIITQNIRNANTVNSPTPATSASILSLSGESFVDNPIVFDVVDGTLRMKEGLAGIPIALTSSRITISNLSFINFARSGTADAVQVKFTISHVNEGGRNEYTFSTDFIGGAGVLAP
ncbi:type II secretion system protein [Candidatus Gracilibacteria bacterium]|nr:type II secretion system protein [Candidatus Gracilibacteria bacterium]